MDSREFYNKFNVNISEKFKEEIEKLERNNLIEVNSPTVKLTNKGLDLANIVWEEFI